MVQSRAATVAEYLAALPDDRREVIAGVREVILKNLPRGYEEGMSYGMISYAVPHALYPAGYHCDPRQPLPFACLAAQKNHCSLYLFCIYGDQQTHDWFVKEFMASGKKLDMGKSCIRFKKLDDLPLDLVGQAIARVPVDALVAFYARARKQTAAGSRKPKITKRKKARR